MENLPKYLFHSENMGVDAKELGDFCFVSILTREYVWMTLHGKKIKETHWIGRVNLIHVYCHYTVDERNPTNQLKKGSLANY